MLVVARRVTVAEKNVVLVKVPLDANMHLVENADFVENPVQNADPRVVVFRHK
jgi:hypothetical protein